MIGFNRSNYYYDHRSKSALWLNKEDDITKAIHNISEQFQYGARYKMPEALRQEGILVNHKRVYRIMRENGLLIKKKPRFVRTTDSNHNHPIHPNLIQNIESTHMNQIWVSDITYIKIQQGFVYLAAIMDAYSRKIVGYSISNKIDHYLTLDALMMAIDNRNIPTGIIHHSDRGSQYACHDYINLLTSHGFQLSMSRKGNVYDNAKMERFMRTIKCEEVYLWDYQTIDDVLERIPFFIDEVYNKKRLHAALGYISPDTFEANLNSRPEVNYV